MTLRRAAAADAARATGLLQHLTVLCDETRRTASADPARIDAMLGEYEATLATLAPVLERLGRSPGDARDTLLAAARQAATSHQALIDTMSLELDRLGRAITDNDHANTATHAYASAQQGAARQAFRAVG